MELSLEKIKTDMDVSKKDLIVYGVDCAEQLLRKKIEEAQTKLYDLNKKHNDSKKALKTLLADEAMKSCKEGIEGLQKGIDYFFKGSTIDIIPGDPNPDTKQFSCHVVVHFNLYGRSKGPKELFELTQRRWGGRPNVMHIPYVFKLSDHSKYEAASTLVKKYYEEWQEAQNYLNKLNIRLQNIGNIERHLKAQLTGTILESSEDGKKVLKQINEIIEKQIGDILMSGDSKE